MLDDRFHPFVIARSLRFAVRREERSQKGEQEQEHKHDQPRYRKFGAKEPFHDQPERRNDLYVILQFALACKRNDLFCVFLFGMRFVYGGIIFDLFRLVFKNFGGIYFLFVHNASLRQFHARIHHGVHDIGKQRTDNGKYTQKHTIRHDERHVAVDDGGICRLTYAVYAEHLFRDHRAAE